MIGYPKIGLVMSLLASLFASRAACALDDAARDRILASQTRLAVVLQPRLSPDPGTDAVMVSPASLAGMLSPLVVAGDEAHRSAMARLLQLAPGSTQLEDLDALRTAASVGRPGEAVETATRFEFDPSIPPTAVAEQALARERVEMVITDPESDQTRAANDAWVSKVTHGKITDVGQPPKGTLVAALNALYFKGQWARPFKVMATSPADFHTAGGDRLRVPFMHSPFLRVPLREDDRFIAVDLPFAGSRYTMVVLTTKDKPDGLASFTDHLAWLDGRQFNIGPTVVVDLPRFSATTTVALLPGLVALGLDPLTAPSGLTVRPIPLVEVRQTLKLEVREEGAEVAALTQGFEVQGGSISATALEMFVDKPFAFALRDRQSGLMIAAGFVSQVAGETLAAEVPPVSAHSGSVMTREQREQEEQQQRAAVREQAQTPSPIDGEARSRVERDF